AVTRAELILDPKAIWISKLHRLVTPANSRFTPADVSQSRALLSPPTVHQILKSGAHSDLKVFNLLGGLILESLCRAVEQPTMVSHVRLHNVLAAPAEFGTFAIGISNVIDKTNRNSRRAVTVFGEKSAAGH